MIHDVGAWLQQQEIMLQKYEHAFSFPRADNPTGLFAVRKRLGLTQAAMADRLGVTSKWLGKLERGQAVIDKRTTLAVQGLVCIASGIMEDPSQAN